MARLNGSAPVVIATVATNDYEARSARLLIDSLRTFGGALARRPVWVFHTANLESNPLLKRVPGVEYFPIVLDEPYRSYPFAYKVYAPAQANELLPRGTSSFIWLDYAAFVLNPPKLFELTPDVDAALRPVFVKNVGSTATEPLDEFWKAIYQEVKLEDGVFHTVRSTDDRQILRPYFNCGGYALNPATNLLPLWWKHFRRLADDDAFQAQCCQDEQHQTFLHQAVFSAVIAKHIQWERISPLPACYGSENGSNPAYLFSYEGLPDPEITPYLQCRPALKQWLIKKMKS